MKTLDRIKKIVRSQKPTALISVGGELMTELQKHLNTLDERISSIELAKMLAQIDIQSWNTINKNLDMKKRVAAGDAKKLQPLNRLVEIAYINTNEATLHLSSYEGKVDELAEIRKRVVQAISMIEVENNIRSVTAMYDGQKGLERQAENLELETREIRRLLYATDGLMEIVS